MGMSANNLQMVVNFPADPVWFPPIMHTVVVQVKDLSHAFSFVINGAYLDTSMHTCTCTLYV